LKPHMILISCHFWTVFMGWLCQVKVDSLNSWNNGKIFKDFKLSNTLSVQSLACIPYSHYHHSLSHIVCPKNPKLLVTIFIKEVLIFLSSTKTRAHLKSNFFLSKLLEKSLYTLDECVFESIKQMKAKQTKFDMY